MRWLYRAYHILFDFFKSHSDDYDVYTSNYGKQWSERYLRANFWSCPFTDADMGWKVFGKMQKFTAEWNIFNFIGAESYAEQNSIQSMEKVPLGMC